MKLTKQYLRYLPSGKFNIITNFKCNAQFVKFDEKYDRYIATGAAEDVIIWDSRLGKKVSVFEGEKFECVCLSACHLTGKLAAGYADGTVIIYDPKIEENVTFSGHRSPITSISFDENGHRLATGSHDTDVVVWDLVSETGLHRLSGHKGAITRVRFMSTSDVIISSSKDSLIKFWELTSGYCFKTLTKHVTEVWDFCLMKNDSFLVTATNDNELRVWKISANQEQTIHFQDDGVDYASPFRLKEIGSILREGLGAVVSLACDRSSQILCCHGKEKLIELFHFVPEEEAQRKYRKKKERMKKKSGSSGDAEIEIPSADSLRFLVTRLVAIRMEAVVKHVDVWFDGVKLKTVSSLHNNCLEVHSVALANAKENVREKLLTNPGHNSDVRSIAFAYDNVGLVSGSLTGVKVWNRETLSCLRTIKTEQHVVCVSFVPGDRYILAGLKSGALLVVDIATGDIVETIAAHSDQLSSLSVLPNKLGVVTTGKDATVKIWNFELFEPSEHSANVLTLIHARTLQLDNPVTEARVSPDSNLMAVAILDFTVKIFFVDTLKFFLCLTGHKMPITCLDISYDSTLIATGSDDRTVKIWGLDYGDCHKSLLAHEDNVTSLKFLPNSHYFFTCAKDGKIKQWDADNFERILTLDAHRGEAWKLALSPNGMYIISCGRDRVLRLYEKSLEPIVLEDERETERENEEESTLATGFETVFQGRSNINLASRKTVTAEKGAELLLECLQVVKQYRSEALECKNTNKEPPVVPPIMIAFNAKNDNEYFSAVLRKIRTGDLEEVLSLLSLASVSDLLELVLPLLQTSNNETETIVRILVFLLRAHHKPMISSGKLLLVFNRLQTLTKQRINHLKDLVACNLHGLLYIQREKEAREGIALFQETFFLKKKADTKKRKKQSIVQTTMLKL